MANGNWDNWAESHVTRASPAFNKAMDKLDSLRKPKSEIDFEAAERLRDKEEAIQNAEWIRTHGAVPGSPQWYGGKTWPEAHAMDRLQRDIQQRGMIDAAPYQRYSPEEGLPYSEAIGLPPMEELIERQYSLLGKKPPRRPRSQENWITTPLPDGSVMKINPLTGEPKMLKRAVTKKEAKAPKRTKTEREKDELATAKKIINNYRGKGAGVLPQDTPAYEDAIKFRNWYDQASPEDLKKVYKEGANWWDLDEGKMSQAGPKGIGELAQTMQSDTDQASLTQAKGLYRAYRGRGMSHKEAYRAALQPRQTVRRKI